ncbi:MAG: winged helix-turn-helix transcriptional regulator [Chloroflexi bacterium]|nr:winged helix-turn-helix transcriptional regulator [Chloroflexota bacterium]
MIRRATPFWQIGPPLSSDYLLQVERDTLKFRLLALLGIAVSIYFRKDVIPAGATTALIVGYLAYTVLLDRVLLPRFQKLPQLPVLGVMLLADTGTVLAALYVIGFDTPVFIFLPMIIVYYSLYMGYVGSIIAATVVSLGYSLLTTTVGPEPALLNVVSIQLPFFFVVAIMTGYLSRQRLQEREEKRALQQFVEAETHARGVVDLTATLLKNLQPAVIAGDLTRLGALTSGAPFCLLLLVDKEQGRLSGLASNRPLSPLGVSEPRLLEEPLSAPSPGAKIARGEVSWALWERGKNGEADLPPWLGPGAVQELAAVAVPKSDGTVQGVLYCMNSDASGMLAPRMEAIREFAALAADVLERISVAPLVEERGTRLLGELRQTVKSMGRFREMQGRQVIRMDALSIDPARELVTVGETAVSLSKAEFDVLYLLAEQAGNPVSKEVLLREVWGENFVAQGNVVDVCVHRLRRKLAETTVGLDLIKTIRGRGYMLQAPGAVKP